MPAPSTAGTQQDSAGRWAERLAGVAAVVALVTLGFWSVGDWRTLALSPRWVPIAPGSAVLVLLLSGAVSLRIRGHAGTAPTQRPGTVSVALAALALLLSLLFLATAVGGVALPIERWFARTDAGVAGIPVGRVSQFTAALFALLSAGLLWPRVSAHRQVEAALALSVLVLSLLMLQGYLLGAPLLYGARTIPVAALTALCLLLLASAALLLAGVDQWPLRLLVLSEQPRGAMPSAASFRTLAAFVSLLIIASGYFWYRGERDETERRSRDSLARTADLKAREVAQWYAGHHTTALALRALPLTPGDVARFATEVRLDPRTAAVATWLRTLQAENQYSVVALFDAQGELLDKSSAEHALSLDESRDRIRSFGGRTDLVIDDVHRDGAELAIKFWVPLGRAAGSGAALAWLLLEIDAERALFPLVREVPLPSETAELVLWRRDADSAVVINDVRHLPDAALRLQVPLDTTTRVAAVFGLLGRTEVAEATDYRGVPVTAAMREIAGTPWMLVAKVDRAELAAPIRRSAVRATVISLLLILGAVTLALALRARRSLAVASRELTLVREREESAEALKRKDRILRVRSACSLALVRAGSEEELLQAVCDVAVREGGYRMAWVGYAEHDARRSVRPMASSGEDRGYLNTAEITWGDDEHGRGPTGRCIRSGEPQAAQDLASEKAYSPWRAAALERGFASSCSIPLRLHDRSIGALMLYSAERHAFDADEVALLLELGADLSFGIGAIRDRRALAEGQAQLALFREVMERSNDAVFLTDAESGRFIDFNETATRNLGYSAAELRAMGPTDIVPEVPDIEEFRAVAREARERDSIIKLRHHRRKDGSLFPVEVALTAIEVGGRRLLLSIARDISDRARAEAERDTLQQQLQRAQRMESVGRLAGGVAHDFNNLLTVINATADLLMADLPAEAPARKDLQQIRGAGDRAAALTRQLLAFSRQQVMRREVLDLNALATDFLAMLRRVIGEDVRVDVRLAPDLAPVLADPGQLEQVLMNLCVNARDAMPGGGTITIATANVELDESHAARHVTMMPGPYVLVSVSDTGEGMDAGTLSRIFEPFFTTKEPGKGTGLGLATVYGIVKQTGGSVWVYSEPGRGSTFKVYLPRAEAVVQERGSGPTAVVTTGSETVLVVEDEEAIRMVVTRVLERAGYSVLGAGSGPEALALVERHPGHIDLVMTDLVMPGMTGLQLAAELRKARPGIKLLFSSGYSAEAVSHEFAGESNWRFISKPYAVKELAQQVRRALDE